ncbi:MAG: ADP-glyceromanno-heptose 6-epimerase [Acidobacteria bacterium]|nr:MAG: ADP-glyceromanno-heptose 6-epimerase [Acidobacteriota bacterium]
MAGGEREKGWQGRRVLVTGGGGFIGSALVWELNGRGCTDIVIADSAPKAERNRYLLYLKFADYLGPQETLSRLAAGKLGQFDFAFHLGASSSTTETNREYLYRNNYEFSRDLAAWALAAGTRFVYASSAATYGDGSAGMDDASPGSLERLKPLNLYGESKHLMDLHAWRQGWLERVLALKYFNVFGPNEEHKGDMRSVVNKSFAQVMQTGVIRLFKSYRPEYRDGEQRRDFLYVKDAVRMTLHLAETRQAAGIFNIGSGKAHSWNDLAGAIFSALGREPRIEYIEMPEAIRDKYQYFTEAKIEQLRSAGYTQPITPLGEAVRDYVQKYLVPGKALGEAPCERGSC